jgi:hypothetical protein
VPTDPELAATVTGTADTAASAPSPGLLLLLLAVLVTAGAVGAARRRRAAARCDRYGHVADPTTLGSWTERCQRCGARL